MQLSQEQIALLSIVRQSLWAKQETIPSADWELVEEIAHKQGVLALLYSGIKKGETCVPDERMRIWRGAMLMGILHNEQLNADQAEIMRLLKDRSIKVAVLKGTSAARFYPQPDVRCLGDIDLLVDPCNLDVVEQVLVGLGYRKLSNGHGFHIGYIRRTTIVEVHYAASEVPKIAGGNAAQKEMNCFLDSVHNVVFNDMEFPVLSDSHQALMMLLHMERHMLEEGIGLRQLCDWAVFVARTDPAHWENYSLAMLKRCGLFIYASVMTKACIYHLGLAEEKATWCLQVSDSLIDELMQDVFRGGDMGKADSGDSSNLFTNRNVLGAENQNIINGLITTLSKLAYRNFPITKKYKILLPLYGAYLPVRYIIRSLLGLRPKKNVLSVIDASNRRYSFYRKLHLYEVR